MKTSNETTALLRTTLALLLGLTLASARAQISTNQSPSLIPNESQTFFQTIGGYLTTINTNYSFTSNTFEVSIGAGQSGSILANYVKAQFDLGGLAPAAGARWDVSTTIRNAGIAGVIQSAELGGGCKVIACGDTAVTVAVEGGWDWNRAAGLIEPQILARKKATRNTFFETGISLPEWTRGAFNKTPAFFVGTGFTY